MRDPVYGPTFVLSVCLASAFLGTAVLKLLGQQRMREQMAHVGVSAGQSKVVGLLELAGVVGLIVGLFWPPAGVAAAVGLVLHMIGAMVLHLRAKDSFSVALTPLFFAAMAGAIVVLHVRAG